LGTVADSSFTTRVLVLSLIALLMTVGVYGLVAAIVKLDDLGVYLAAVKGPASPVLGRLGNFILAAAPVLMKGLSILGTAAMFLVGGGILTHGIPPVHHAIHDLVHHLSALPIGGGFLHAIAPLLFDGLFGILAGGIVVVLLKGYQAVRKKAA
jgi:predicted DNA repair protein MutK